MAEANLVVAAFLCGLMDRAGRPLPAVRHGARDRLPRAWDERLHRRMVRLNWARTAAWTAQTGVAVALL